MKRHFVIEPESYDGAYTPTLLVTIPSENMSDLGLYLTAAIQEYDGCTLQIVDSALSVTIGGVEYEVPELLSNGAGAVDVTVIKEVNPGDAEVLRRWLFWVDFSMGVPSLFEDVMGEGGYPHSKQDVADFLKRFTEIKDENFKLLLVQLKMMGY